MDAYIGIAGVAVGVVGIVLTIYFARQAQHSNRLRKRLEWSDLQAAAQDLGRRIKRDCTPSALVTSGLTGATFANLLTAEFDGQPPVYVGTRAWKEDPHFDANSHDSYDIETNKWFVSIPKAPTRHADGTILIVEDFVMSGDFLSALKQALLKAGVQEERIRSASIAVTKVAVGNHKAPDYYWWLADDDDFYFPWGKAR